MHVLNESAILEKAKREGVTHISTGLAITRDGKILVARRVAGDFLGGVYELPGGGVDESETVAETAIREAKEETDLTVSKILAAFEGFDYSTDKKPHVRQLNFLVEVEEGEVALNPEEHDDFQWIDESDRETFPMTDNMKQCVVAAFEAMRHLA